MQRMHLALQRSAPLSEQGERRGTRTCSEKNRQRANRLSTQTDGCRKNLMKHTASHSSENYKGIKVTFSSLQTIFILYHTRSFNYHRDLSDDRSFSAVSVPSGQGSLAMCSSCRLCYGHGAPLKGTIVHSWGSLCERSDEGEPALGPGRK